IMIGAVGGLKFIWQFLDLMLACVVIPNILAVFFLSNKVQTITDDYFTTFISSKKEKTKSDTAS
ncbi:alanine:cation symporter family protein, partial [Streptococcus sobrinus]